jgi:hypothetical protein
VCETHSLLDCPCNGNGVLVDKALLSDDADFDLPGFLPASQYTETKVPPHISIGVDEQKKHKFDALHEYWHFDTWGWKEGHGDDEYLCDIIEDTVLRTVIEKNLSEEVGGKTGASYLFGVRRG